MTKEQAQFLTDLRGLDKIGLGMLQPSSKVKRWRYVRYLLEVRKWIRVEDEAHPSGELVCYLRTRGLKALRRHRERMCRQQDERPTRE